MDTSDIEYCELSIVDCLPQIKVIFRDVTALSNDKKFPTDDTKISLFLNSRSKNLNPIHLDFKIIDFRVFKGKINCTGVIDVSSLYLKQFKSYSNLSSFNVLRKISDDTGLGFYSNVQNTDDQMTWLNTGKKVFHFIQDIFDRCYLSDQSFLFGYIDYYYNLTLVDLEQEIKRNIKDQKGVVTVIHGEISDDPNYEETIGPLASCNDIAFQDTNLYFTDYKILNRSTKVSINTGYTTRIKFYDKLNKDNLEFDVEPLSDKSASKIQLRGQVGDNLFKNQNLEYIWGGKLDTNNVHKNWNYAKVQNDRNIFDLEKLGLEIQLPNPNFNLYKFQKVTIQISNQGTTPTQDHINQRLSGEWLIVDIKFRYESKSFRQIVTLFKRDLELSDTELNG
jgi:hypothetical protein